MNHSGKIIAGMLSLFILVAFAQVSIGQETEKERTAEQIEMKEARMAKKAERQAAREEAKIAHEALKSRADAIKANTELSQIDKEELLAEVKAERKALKEEMPRRREGKKGKYGEKGKKAKKAIKRAERLADVAEGKEVPKKEVKNKKVKTFDGNIDQERLEKSIQQLEKVQKKLSKSLEKEKISQADYETRMVKVTEIKSRLQSVLAKEYIKK